MKDEETFTSILHTIAEKTIPKTSAVPRKLNKPWWTEDAKKYTIIGKKLLITSRNIPQPKN